MRYALLVINKVFLYLEIDYKASHVVAVVFCCNELPKHKYLLKNRYIEPKIILTFHPCISSSAFTIQSFGAT